MLKLIHTADWHLGQQFYDYSRREEHADFLNWLLEQISQKKPDALLISGDVFDTPNPSAEAQRMYYNFLRLVTEQNPSLQVIVTAGNHDSAARLEAPNPLLESMNVTVRGVVKRTPQGEIDYERLIVPLGHDAYCLAVPYLRQGDYGQATVYAEGVKAFYDELYSRVPEDAAAVVAMGHLHVLGSEVSDNDRSERIVVGGIECVTPDAFNARLNYVALGHLHRAQRVGGREEVRYAGAPLAMSFAEQHNRQGVTMVSIDQETQVQHLEYENAVKLMRIPAKAEPLDEVLKKLSNLPDGEVTDNSPFVEVLVSVTAPEPSMRYQIENVLQNKAVKLTRIESVIPHAEREDKTIVFEELNKISPFDMAVDIYKRAYNGNEMPEQMQTLLQTIIREVEE